MTDDAVNTRQLMAEIEAEARARRVGGTLPRGFEAELNEKFNRLVPKGTENDYASSLRRATNDAMFDYAPPIASARKGGAAVKKGLSKLTSWYIRHLGQQMTSFAFSITSAVRALGERVERLESTMLGADAAGVAGIAREVLPLATSSTWNNLIVARFKGEAGRVLVARAGDGALVRALVDQGVGGYGIEPGDPERIEDIDPTLEVRSDDLARHLRSISEPELAGVVLIGLSDTLAIGAVCEVLERLNDVLLPGATIAVVTTDPEQWRRERGGLIADVVAGHPLAPATWVQLLQSFGYVDIDVTSGEPKAIIHDVPGTDATVVALNEQLRALEAAIAVAPSHCICARRPE